MLIIKSILGSIQYNYFLLCPIFLLTWLIFLPIFKLSSTTTPKIFIFMLNFQSRIIYKYGYVIINNILLWNKCKNRWAIITPIYGSKFYECAIMWIAFTVLMKKVDTHSMKQSELAASKKTRQISLWLKLQRQNT